MRYPCPSVFFSACWPPDHPGGIYFLKITSTPAIEDSKQKGARPSSLEKVVPETLNPKPQVVTSLEDLDSSYRTGVSG